MSRFAPLRRAIYVLLGVLALRDAPGSSADDLVMWSCATDGPISLLAFASFLPWTRHLLAANASRFLLQLGASRRQCSSTQRQQQQQQQQQEEDEDEGIGERGLLVGVAISSYSAQSSWERREETPGSYHERLLTWSTGPKARQV